MREMLKLGATLAVTCVIAAGAIAGVNDAVKGTIAENNRKEAILKRQQVFPAAKEFEERAVDGRAVFVAKDAAGTALGLVVTFAPRGYAGPIGMTIGISPDGAVAGLDGVTARLTPLAAFLAPSAVSFAASPAT